MNLPFFFAWRYLFAKKSHNVINIISAISAVGMAIGTAALIIVLSIYNGFDSLVKSMLNDFDPDILITPAEGKAFVPEGPAYDWIYGQEIVKNMYCVITENVFVNYDGRQGMVTAKGADWVYEEESPLREHIRSGLILTSLTVTMAPSKAAMPLLRMISAKFLWISLATFCCLVFFSSISRP